MSTVFEDCEEGTVQINTAKQKKKRKCLHLTENVTCLKARFDLLTKK